MTTPPRTPRSDRLFLAFLLSMANLFALALALVLVFPLASGREVGKWPWLAMVVGPALVARLSRRLLPDTDRYPVAQRFVAGVLGLFAAALVGPLMRAAGIEPDALSHQPSPWALVQEAVAISLTYGALIGITYSVLIPTGLSGDRLWHAATGRRTMR